MCLQQCVLVCQYLKKTQTVRRRASFYKKNISTPIKAINHDICLGLFLILVQIAASDHFFLLLILMLDVGPIFQVLFHFVEKLE